MGDLVSAQPRIGPHLSPLPALVPWSPGCPGAEPGGVIAHLQKITPQAQTPDTSRDKQGVFGTERKWMLKTSSVSGV